LNLHTRPRREGGPFNNKNGGFTSQANEFQDYFEKIAYVAKCHRSPAGVCLTSLQPLATRSSWDGRMVGPRGRTYFTDVSGERRAVLKSPPPLGESIFDSSKGMVGSVRTKIAPLKRGKSENGAPHTRGRRECFAEREAGFSPLLNALYESKNSAPRPQPMQGND
jgi:hypothetical protein